MNTLDIVVSIVCTLVFVCVVLWIIDKRNPDT